ncbi:MAG TPA: alpha/beta hydrolase [Polyangiaceae bacterium]
MQIIFLHGMALDGSIWRRQLDAFPRALAPDIPGFGSRQLEGQADLGELEPLVNGAHVVGHSFGAAVAIDLALRHRSSIRSLVLVNPLLLRRATNLAAWATCVERARAGDLEGARAAWLACPLFAGARAQAREAMAAYRGGHWTGAVQTAFSTPDPAPELERLTLPVLVITATRDQPAFQAMAREYHQALQGSRLVELDAGHMSPCECPAEFNAALRTFFEEQGLSSASS